MQRVSILTDLSCDRSIAAGKLFIAKIMNAPLLALLHL